MTARSAVALPAAIKSTRREDAWGRLAALSASGAMLTTLSAPSRGEALLLSFELAGEKFRDIPAYVEASEIDADGYHSAELRWTDEVERRRLARLLLDVLSRA
jgi:hypothetical protein